MSRKEPYVFGWNFDGRSRAVVLTKSRAAVKRYVEAQGHHVSLGYLRDFGSDTGNEEEIRVAHEAGEGVVMIQPERRPGSPWHPLEPTRWDREKEESDD